MSEAVAPSGAQIEIHSSRLRAVVVEVGGGLRELTYDGHHLLDGYAADAMADGGRGQPLLPWPNRLEDGQYEFDGHRLQLPIDNPAQHNAMHGLTRWRNWSSVDRADDRVRVEHRLYPEPGYPFTLELSIEYRLDASGLTVETTATNRGTDRLPFGAGFHPYFTVGTQHVGQAELQLPARQIVELDPHRMLPTGKRVAVEGSQLDFRAPRLVGSTVMDNCFTDLQRGADGRARVRVRNPDSGLEIAVWVAEPFGYIQAFTGETLAPARRRQGIAIEPMTCPPNAFHTGTDVIIIESGQARAMAWG
ncbi:MAG: aldose 1-epimerase family protein, partial [Chloroflexi bacterium]|nr:aldose 1-epimerase family protein [Chloroflexota bacterium]